MPPVAIEGTIASGKTSVLEAVNRATGLSVTYEPVDAWEPFLQAAYESNTGHVALQARITLDTCCKCPDTDLVERSPLLQPLTFIPALHLHQQSISHLERTMLNELHARLLTWAPAHTIFLTCSLSAAKQRIRTRGRGCEKSIDGNYLAILHGLYEAAIQAFPDSSVIDTTDKPLDMVVAEVLAILKQVGHSAAAHGSGAQPGQPPDCSSTTSKEFGQYLRSGQMDGGPL